MARSSWEVVLEDLLDTCAFLMVTIHEVKSETYVKVTRTEHSIPPLRFDDSDGSQVGLDIAC